MPFDPTKPAPGDDLDAVPNGVSTFTSLAMNLRLFLPALLAASLANAQPAAPDAAPAKAENPAAAADAKTEMQKWIEATDAPWQAAFKRDVSDVREAEVKKVMLQYLTSLEEAIRKASGADDLKGALALRNEQKRFGDAQVFPEKDEDGDAPAVKAVRGPIRAQLAQSEAKNAGRAKALHARYDQILSQAQTQLTKAQRLDDAQLVQTKRDEVAAAWITPAVVAALEKGITPAPPPTSLVQKPATATAPKEPAVQGGGIKDLRKGLAGTVWKAVPPKPLRGGLAATLTFTDKVIMPGDYDYKILSHDSLTMTFHHGDTQAMMLAQDGKHLKFTAKNKTDYVYELVSPARVKTD